jgi:O-antigen/teichoic acid export membrane protein
MNKTVVQIFKNLITGWGAIVLNAAIGLYMVPFLLGHMGKEGYGVVGILLSVVGFAEIADLGLRAALNRELSEKVAREDREGFQSLTSSALILYLCVASALVVAVWSLAPWFCSLFNVGDQYRDLTILLLRTYAALSVVLSFVIPVFSAGLCSFLRYDIQNNVTIISKVCVSSGLLLTLSLVQAHPLILWCTVMGAGEVIRLLMMIFYYRRVCYGGKIALSFINLKGLVPLFSLGGSMYVLQLTNVLAQRLDPLIISRFLGLGNVALYQAGSGPAQMARPIVLAAASQLIPLTTKFHVSNNQNREQQILVLGTKYTLYLGVFFSAGIILFADTFCHLWLFDKLGNDVKTVALVLKMWAVADLFNYAGGMHWPIILGKKKMKFAMWLTVPAAIFNVILSVVLVKFTNLGIPGVLVGTVISEMIRRPIAVWYVSKITMVPLVKYCKEAYLIPIIFFVTLLSIGHIGISGLRIEIWTQFILFVVLFTLGCGALFVSFEWKTVWRYRTLILEGGKF